MNSMPMSDWGITVFDDIVIGSSPLMLLQAGLLAREGRKVCLLERAERPGGAWQTAVLNSSEVVEIACHLIEVFPGIYEFLEGASGVPFVPLGPQPIRIHRTGLRVAYFSKLLMLASGVRLILGWARAQTDVWLGRAPDRNKLINFHTKLSSYMRYQGPAFFQRPIMQGPKHGFVDFLERLVARCKADGVGFHRGDVVGLQRQDGVWQVKLANGPSLQAHHVHCTTSTNLRQHAPGQFQAIPQEFAHRLAVVVEVAKADLLSSQTYVAFWKDPAIARISRIDMPNQTLPHERFLVEFHERDIAPHGARDTLIRDRLEKARIIAPGGAYRSLGDVDCTYTFNVDQLPAGRIDDALWGYYSTGNLAAGLSAWRKTDRLPDLPAALRVAP